jgi:hypothetical protein
MIRRDMVSMLDMGFASTHYVKTSNHMCVAGKGMSTMSSMSSMSHDWRIKAKQI